MNGKFFVVPSIDGDNFKELFKRFVGALILANGLQPCRAGCDGCCRFSQTTSAISLIGFFGRAATLCRGDGSLRWCPSHWAVLLAARTCALANITALCPAFVKAHKNDDRDAEAAAEAAIRRTMSFDVI